jgi:hypothetical protein
VIIIHQQGKTVNLLQVDCCLLFALLVFMLDKNL